MAFPFSSSPRILKTGAVLMTGAALGGAGGYAASASGAGASAGSAHHARSARHGRGARAARHERGLSAARLRHAVTLTAVLPNGHGGFATVSLQRGTLVSSSGDSLTLREGTPRATYRQTTLTVPANAVVRLAHEPSSLSALSAGDRVTVVQGPRRTLISARPPQRADKQAAGATEQATGE